MSSWPTGCRSRDWRGRRGVSEVSVSEFRRAERPASRLAGVLLIRLQMSLRFRYRAVTFSDGTRVELPEQGVVVLVGPNNAGKSAALRDIFSKLQAGMYVPLVVTDIEIEKAGSVEELEEWLSTHFIAIEPPPGTPGSRNYRRASGAAATAHGWPCRRNGRQKATGFLRFNRS
jgi:hypothetical protein